MKPCYEHQMKKGTLEIIVLKLISIKPTYGYDLLSSITQKSDGFLQLREGTLYPILYRLEDDGFIVSKWSEENRRGKPKKIYTITSAGDGELRKLTQIWTQFAECVSNMLKEENTL
nr:helix-turn-helix transcriptional regulator [uncultured Caproiciproducens sp.]